MPFEGSGRAAASTTSPLKDGSRAIGSREPCQVGNQAALSGSAGVPRGRLSRGQILTYACGRCSILDVWPYYVSSRFVSYGKAVFFVYLALYRKWRPQTFSDVRGQDHITAVLRNQAESGRISHAYLFCGSRGTGKTTTAKILAKAANCLDLQNGDPCNRCENCRAIDAGTTPDVLEIDAASNNSVENIRDLREEVIYPPSMLKKRVYIIDEVHMLSTSAFNALLKTLEEPPAHVTVSYTHLTLPTTPYV